MKYLFTWDIYILIEVSTKSKLLCNEAYVHIKILFSFVRFRQSKFYCVMFHWISNAINVILKEKGYGQVETSTHTRTHTSTHSLSFNILFSFIVVASRQFAGKLVYYEFCLSVRVLRHAPLTNSFQQSPESNRSTNAGAQSGFRSAATATCGMSYPYTRICFLFWASCAQLQKVHCNISYWQFIHTPST